MKHVREKLMSHILMVVAPLLVLLMITVAWFISSQTINWSEMSFAAQDSGPGAVLYPVKELGTRKPTDKTTLTYDSITWDEKLAPEDSDITIENMLPGQCNYYLLVSKDKFVPRLLNIKITDADGKEVTGADKKLLMTQCLGLYLVPTTIDLSKDPAGQTELSPTSISLTRADGLILDAAIFKDGPSAVDWPKIEKGSEKHSYILAVYCDPVYGQNGPDAKGTHVGTLPGTISFSLAFDKAEEP